jgi:hypothetical protein
MVSKNIIHVYIQFTMLGPYLFYQTVSASSPIRYLLLKGLCIIAAPEQGMQSLLPVQILTRSPCIKIPLHITTTTSYITNLIELRYFVKNVIKLKFSEYEPKKTIDRERYYIRKITTRRLSRKFTFGRMGWSIQITRSFKKQICYNLWTIIRV